MSFVPKPHEIYKHFKGNLYQIIAIAEHTETGETLVVYQALYGDFKTYARPLSMFVSPVDKAKYPDVAQEFRFELQKPGGWTESGQEPGTGGQPEAVGQAQADKPSESAGSPESVGKPEDVSQAQAAGLPNLDPAVLAFLDADTYAERLNILTGLHSRITDDMITTMAFACDVEVEEGDLETRYLSLKKCVQTKERFECNRLRR